MDSVWIHYGSTMDPLWTHPEQNTNKSALFYSKKCPNKQPFISWIQQSRQKKEAV